MTWNTMNLCVTLNPCLDKTLEVPPWTPGEHQVRGRACGQMVGGKGVNVARALARLGHPARPALFLGGELGHLCERLLREQDRFEPIVTWTAAPTREVLTVRTEGTADQTGFFDPNPAITSGERDAFVSQVAAAFAGGARWCAMSGSSPCVVTDDVYAHLVHDARRLGVSTVVDTYGACFPVALAAAPDVVKLNCLECEQALGLTLDTATAVETAVRRIRGAGAGSVAITFGSRGMVAAWDEHIVAWKPPSVHLINPIGAGDAMTAGIIDALSRGEDPDAAFRWGMACAVASVENWLACDFQPAEAKAMRSRIAECSLQDLTLGSTT
jgi:1-phosphofructokinase family hexose kinase